MIQHKKLQRMVLSALFVALAYVLPFLTGQIPEIGAMLCPMHIPVLLCGYFCGPAWGAVVGIAAPLLRSLTLGMPPPFPTAVCMAAELAAYGAIAGWLHRHLPARRGFVYVSLPAAMIVGRLVWGLAMTVCMGFGGGSFPLSAFLSGAVLNAVPGIILQLVLIPVLVMTLKPLTESGTR
ncbi:MAG: ECF transporter S component [Clostridia bacterium]|nr:ECF transporter S component [Clostridia bacterium]